MKGLVAISFSLIALCWAAGPNWFNSPTSLVGNVLTVTCNSTGPDNATAKVSALNECKTIAAEYLTHEIRVQNTTIQTERDSALHSSVTSDSKITDLNCVPLREESLSTGNQETVYLQCKFDLNQAKVKSEQGQLKDGGAEQRLEALATGKPKSVPEITDRYIASDKRTVSVSTVPKCSSILIQGKFPKIINCKSNVVSILIEPGDTEIILRAKGKLPKTILVKDLLETGSENVQVVFD